MFGKVLLAVDGSESSERATKIAAEIAQLGGGEVVVCHVTEAEPEMSRGGLDPGEVPDTGVSVADHAAKSLAEAGVSTKIDIHTASHSRVAHEIVDAANAADADVIVMGRRGLAELSAIVLGSITHKVLHLSDRPVLIVH